MKPNLSDVYNAMLKVKPGGNTDYPDCTGLVVSIPDGVSFRVVSDLVAAGKFCLRADGNGDPVMHGVER